MKDRVQKFVRRFCVLCMTCALIVCESSGESSSDSSKVIGIFKKLQSLKKIAGEAKGPLISGDASNLHVDVEGKGYGGGHGGGGGYGHGGGGYGHGAITLDPVSIISLLALGEKCVECRQNDPNPKKPLFAKGAFLINNILQLLQQNTASGRSLDVDDLNLPLQLSDIRMDNEGLEHYARGFDNQDEDEFPSFSHFFANLGSLYYLHPNKRNVCIKKVVCNYVNAKESRSQDVQRSLRTRIFDFMLTAITRFVAPEITERSGSGTCQKFNKHCSDSVLEDAKITTENKVYSTMTSLASNFAIQSLLSG